MPIKPIIWKFRKLEQNDFNWNKILSGAKMWSAFVLLVSSLVNIMFHCCNFCTALKFGFSENTTVQTQDHPGIPKSIVAFWSPGSIECHPPSYRLHLIFTWSRNSGSYYACNWNAKTSHTTTIVQEHPIAISRGVWWEFYTKEKAA